MVQAPLLGEIRPLQLPDSAWTTEELLIVEGWGHGENSFLDDPPNAVLAFLEEGDEVPEDVVVTLTNPRLEGSELTYSATILEGELPATSGPCSLFIDPIGRPLSPMSVMGVRRRQRRRNGRRI